MVASAAASVVERGPTTRSVGGADSGDLVVGGGGAGASSLTQALGARRVVARRKRTRGRVPDMNPSSFCGGL